ncbi:hypothetical protein [Variovorax atrisoli]|uniref:hypothetical protein n=1 Tax=Variovorax atrisoli TaxID=3394203 RepID=UPI0004777943|nr:hypothetical protein [Variovorax paradoxus]
MAIATQRFLQIHHQLAIARRDLGCAGQWLRRLLHGGLQCLSLQLGSAQTVGQRLARTDRDDRIHDPLDLPVQLDTSSLRCCLHALVPAVHLVEQPANRCLYLRQSARAQQVFAQFG